MNWDLYQKAIHLCIDRFESKKYGQLPYMHHLLACERQLGIYFMHPLTPQSARKLPLETCNHILQAVVLHDILEDTQTTYGELKLTFGTVVADMVLAVTNPPKEEGTRVERFKSVYPKIRKTPNAIIVKLCDRIANFESCITHRLSKDRSLLSGKLNMYISEHETFRAELFNPSERHLKRMWLHLDSLASIKLSGADDNFVEEDIDPQDLLINYFGGEYGSEDNALASAFEVAASRAGKTGNDKVYKWVEAAPKTSLVSQLRSALHVIGYHIERNSHLKEDK